MKDENPKFENLAGMEKRSANKDWLRALQRTASIEANDKGVLPTAFDAIAATRGRAIAVIDERESLSFAQFGERAN